MIEMAYSILWRRKLKLESQTYIDHQSSCSFHCIQQPPLSLSLCPAWRLVWFSFYPKIPSKTGQD